MVEKAEDLVCIDCNKILQRKSRNGPLPKRCSECKTIKTKKTSSDWQKKNREILNERARQARKDNPEKFREHSRKSMAKRRKEQPEAVKQAKIRSTYNITDEEHSALKKRADGKCELCGITLSDDGPTREVIDHDHETGAVRGLLCNNCNMGLGYVEDSPQLLEQLAQYLEDPPRIKA